MLGLTGVLTALWLMVVFVGTEGCEATWWKARVESSLVEDEDEAEAVKKSRQQHRAQMALITFSPSGDFSSFPSTFSFLLKDGRVSQPPFRPFETAGERTESLLSAAGGRVCVWENGIDCVIIGRTNIEKHKQIHSHKIIRLI